MKKTLATLLVSLLLCGCASSHYGYSPEAWNRMSQQQRELVKSEAERRLEQMQEKQREKEFVYHPVDVIFGSRSNVYGDRRNLY